METQNDPWMEIAANYERIRAEHGVEAARNYLVASINNIRESGAKLERQGNYPPFLPQTPLVKIEAENFARARQESFRMQNQAEETIVGLVKDLSETNFAQNPYAGVRERLFMLVKTKDVDYAIEEFQRTQAKSSYAKMLDRLTNKRLHFVQLIARHKTMEEDMLRSLIETRALQIYIAQRKQVNARRDSLKDAMAQIDRQKQALDAKKRQLRASKLEAIDVARMQTITYNKESKQVECDPQDWEAFDAMTLTDAKKKDIEEID